MSFPRDAYPYTNFHELNLGYFIVHFREIFSQWADLYDQMTDWKDATDEELSTWKAGVEADLDQREAALRAELETWKAQTGQDIAGWEDATLAALTAWKTATQAVFEAIRVEAAGSASAAAASAGDAATAKTAAETAQAAAEAAAASVQASAAQITTNTEDIADLKTQLSEIIEPEFRNYKVTGIADDVFKGSSNVTSTTITITGNGSYKTYCFTVDNNYQVYFDDNTISDLTYLSVTHAEPPLGTWTGDDTYRYITGTNPARVRKSENNLPTKNAPLSVVNGEILCVTIPVDTDCDIWINNGKVLNEDIKIPRKTGYVKHETGTFDRANERLSIYTPAENGYILYRFYHYESDAVNADTWGIYNAYKVDDELNNETALTTNGEWECAIKLSGRPDFSGGIMHGDEHYSILKIYVDNKEIPLSSLNTLTEFGTLRIVEDSVLLDPNDSVTEIADHGREYNFDIVNGLILNQSLTWKISASTGSSYMAMFTPLKTVTNTYYTDIGYTPTTIPTNPNIEVQKAKKSRIYSVDSKFYAEFDILDYPTGLDEYGDMFMLTDNNGGLYNKMYYKICNGYTPSVGEVWRTTTHYKLHIVS